MIIHKFNSINNKNNIKQEINNKLNIQVNNSFDVIIDETTKYIISNVSNEIPNNINENEYLSMMNKKLIDIVLPIIKNKVGTNKKNIIPPAVNKERNNIDNLFDPILMNNYKNNIPIIEYPKQSYDRKPNFELNKIEEKRDELIPKMKPVDVTRIQAQIQNNAKNEDKGKTLQMYNELLTSYSQPLNQKENDNQYESMSTPIDQLEAFNYNIPSEIEFNNSSFKNELLLMNSDSKNNNNDSTKSLKFSAVKENPIPLFLEPTIKIVEKKYYIIFDSLYRNLYEYPNPTNFQIKFAPSNNNILYNTYYDQYNTLIINEKSFVNNSIDMNVQETFDNILSISVTNCTVPSNAISYNENVGLNIFNDPYLYLVIPEIKGPYRGGNTITYNSFAKLVIDMATNIPGSIFSNLIINRDEKFIYNPVLAGKIDKMTLNMYNRDGQLYNFGIDKLYIAAFKSGTTQYNSFCGKLYTSTIFTIQNTNNEYAKYCSIYSSITPCNYLNSHPVDVGDKLYFYSTLPTDGQIAYFEDNIYIHKMKYNGDGTANLYIGYKRLVQEKEKLVYVQLANIIPNALFRNYYVVVFDKISRKYYYLTINSFETNYVNINIHNMPKYTKFDDLIIGISQKNLSGINDDSLNSLFTKYGYIVLSVGQNENDKFDIEINCPYENLNENILNGYEPGSIFLIQNKMQISYNFEIVSQIKNYDNVNSKLNESGNN